jgi:hypothetical protein
MSRLPTVMQLGQRDQMILNDLGRVRLLTGRQLERLHFQDLANDRARGSARRRTMGRLSSSHLVLSLPRRVGGERAGSAGLVYALDSTGQAWLSQHPRHLRPSAAGRTRRPWPIGWGFVCHTLDVAELYVRLRELERRGLLRLTEFRAEPDSWHSSAIGTLKPDAYAVWQASGWEKHVWLEVDRGTESLPALRRKLLLYVDAANAGDSGPLGVLPQVLVTVRIVPRLTAVEAVIAELPPPGPQLVSVEPLAEAPRLAPRPPPV